MRINLKIQIKILLFSILILSYCLTSNDSRQDGSSLIKYGSLILCILFEVYEYYCKERRKNKIMKKEYLRLFLFAGVILIYSIIHSILTKRFSFRTLQELFFLVAPMSYGYLVINTWSKKDIDKALRIGIVISFLCYIISLDMNIQLIIYNLFNTNFSNSYSELESFTYCGLALAFCLYFCYYNKSKFFMLFSIIFVFMTFKRLFIIISIVLLVLAQFKIREKKVSKYYSFIIIVLLFVFAIIYFYAMDPINVSKLEIKYNIDISKFTMTRSDRMRWLLNSNYISYGFGSSNEFMYKRFYGALEMETSKIIIELGYFPVLMFFYSFLLFARKNIYTFVYMSLMMLNMVFSSGLTGTFAWCIIYISISMITRYPENSWKKEGLYGK